MLKKKRCKTAKVVYSSNSTRINKRVKLIEPKKDIA